VTVRPRKIKGAMPARSVRVSDDIWDKARARAEYDGVTVSHVAYLLLEGYAKGLLNLPQVRVIYSQPEEPEPEAVTS
jgi:hypothetical protein